MYRAKDYGKARYEIFDTTMHTRAVTLLRLESDLRRALEKGELCVYYQPIVSLASRELYGFEALVRWQHPEREETALILPIGLQVLREACNQLRKWQQRSPCHRDLIMSVNLSGKQLMQPDLIERIEEVLHESKIDPWHLEARDYRDGRDGQSGAGCGDACETPWPRRSPEHRRFWHGILVVELSQPLLGRHVEDRSFFRH
jgi:predicted signal transduction protein with EAL and GGDEF domain